MVSSADVKIADVKRLKWNVIGEQAAVHPHPARQQTPESTLTLEAGDIRYSLQSLPQACKPAASASYLLTLLPPSPKGLLLSTWIRVRYMVRQRVGICVKGDVGWGMHTCMWGQGSSSTDDSGALCITNQRPEGAPLILRLGTWSV